MTHPATRSDLTSRLDGPDGSGRRPDIEEHASVWTWRTLLGCLLTAVGFGTYLAYASEQADRQNAGVAVPGWVETGVAVGAVLLLAGCAVLVWEGIRRARTQGRGLVPRIAGQIGLGLLSMFAGFVVMLIVVRAAFG